jgi:hypothetical protein
MYKLAENLSVREFPKGTYLLFNSSGGEHYEINESAYYLMKDLISKKERRYLSIDDLEREVFESLCLNYGVSDIILLEADSKEMARFLLDEFLIIHERSFNEEG